MIPRDFDRQFDETRRRIARTRRVISTLVIIIWTLIIGTGGWLLLHPENVGAFFGRIAAGFTEVGGSTNAR